MLTLKQAAEYLQLSADTVTKLCSDGEIRHMRVGPKRGRYRFHKQWLDDYLEDCTVEPTPSIQKQDRKPLLLEPLKKRPESFRELSIRMFGS